MELAQKKAKSIVEYIRVTREAKGYTQDYLAAKLAISQNAYSKLELGYSSLTVARLFAIALILEMEPSALFSSASDIMESTGSIDDNAVSLELYKATL